MDELHTPVPPFPPCRLIKEFEMDARADGMPAPMLAERKRELVNQVGAACTPPPPLLHARSDAG